ncbi:hypothetical protein [Paracidovorax citrulli]|uniref:hypothetical protein n=1 Tax=Paracidovorax citrulli TaxID=80869 RepID=UPI003FA7BE96
MSGTDRARPPSKLGKNLNNRRHDHTSWLTHFVRGRDPDQDFPGTTEEEYLYYAGEELDPDAGAFDVLKAIIRLGGIKPGYSFRGGRTTIYGGKPAVCATEMPLYSLAKYAKSRAKQGNVSVYGIAFLKSEFYASGGRPAIYGLSTDDVSYVTNTDTSRILAESVLPRSEQYRYVAYNPALPRRRLDWSHEREWRWIPRHEQKDEIWAKEQNGLGPTPALPVFKGRIDGRHFTKVCIIVWSNDEAEDVRNLLTGLYLAGSNNYGTPFDKSLIERSSIIVLEAVVKAVEEGNDINSQTIEGLAAAQLLQPITITTPPPNAQEIVNAAYAEATRVSAAAHAAYEEEHGSSFSGFAHVHVATKDLTNPIVQYLLDNKMADGPFDSEVWISVPGVRGSGDAYRGEAVCAAVAKVFRDSFGIEVYVTVRDD